MVSSNTDILDTIDADTFNCSIKNLLFLGLSETWLHKGHKEAELQIENFTSICYDSSRKKIKRGCEDTLEKYVFNKERHCCII